MSNADAEDVIDLAASAGLYLDPWQKRVIRNSSGVGADGKWSAFEVGLIVPRQNGKGSIIEARELAGLFLFGEKMIIHTAHEFKTANEAFKRISKLIRQSPHLMRHVRGYKIGADPNAQVSGIMTGNGFQSIVLKNGAELRFLARSTGSGRGFTCDLLILDEAYALTPSQMDAIIPTLSARMVEFNPQIWYTSSAGLLGSDALAEIRRRGMGETTEDDDPFGLGDTLYYAEWSVDPDVEGFDPMDPYQWAIANPALGYRLSMLGILKERRTLTDTGFARERLGVWEKVGGESVFPAGAFEKAGPQDDELIEAGEIYALSVDVQPDHSTASLTAVSFIGEEAVHIEIIEHDYGTDWVVDKVQAILRSSNPPVAVVVDGSGAASSLLPDFRRAKVRVMVVAARDYARSCGRFYDLFMQGLVVHNGDESLRDAFEASRRSPMGEGMWRWARKNVSADISPLCSATLALHGLEKRGRRQLTRKTRTPSGRRKATVLQ